MEAGKLVRGLLFHQHSIRGLTSPHHMKDALVAAARNKTEESL
jgi:hypothetical protein